MKWTRAPPFTGDGFADDESGIREEKGSRCRIRKTRVGQRQYNVA